MYERFTERAKKVMKLAYQEAQRTYREYISTEDMLLGLVIEGSGVAANVLKDLNADLGKIRFETERIKSNFQGMANRDYLIQTPHAKKVIEYANEEASNLGHDYIGTEHLLLGLLREDGGMIVQVLKEQGLGLEQVHNGVVRLLGPTESVQKANKRKQEIDDELEEYPVIKSLRNDIEQLQLRKVAAIEDKDWESAGRFRDEAEKIKKEIKAIKTTLARLF